MIKDRILELIDKRLGELDDIRDQDTKMSLRRVHSEISLNKGDGQVLPQEAGANQLFIYGVDLLADGIDTFDYPDVENELVEMFGADTTKANEKKLIRAYDSLLKGHFSQAINLLDELVNDPELKNFVHQRIMEVRQQQNQARDALLERAKIVEAKPNVDANTKANEYRKVLFVAPQNQTAEHKVAELTLTTGSQRDKQRLDEINTQLERGIYLGDLSKLEDIRGEILQIQTNFRTEPDSLAYATETYERFYEYFSTMRTSLGQLSTAQQLGKYDQAIKQVRKLRDLGAQTVLDAQNVERDIEEHLENLSVLQSAEQLEVAKRRLDEAEQESEAGRAMVAQEKATEAQKLIDDALLYFEQFETGIQDLYRELESQIETVISQYEREVQNYKEADSAVQKAEEQRTTNLESAITQLRQAKRIYPKFPDIDQLLEEYESLRGEDVGRELQAQIEVVELDIEFSRSLEDVQEIKAKLDKLEQLRGSNSIPKTTRDALQKIQRSFHERRQQFMDLDRKIRTISSAIQDNDFEYAEDQLGSVPSQFYDHEEISRLRRLIRRLTGNDDDLNLYNNIVNYFRNSRWHKVIEDASEIETIDYRKMVVPMQQRAQIYLKEQEAQRLRNTQNLEDLQLALDRLNEALTSSHTLEEDPTNRVETTENIQKRLQKSITELDEQLKQLDEIVRIELGAKSMANNGHYKRAVESLHNNLEQIDDEDKKNRLTDSIQQLKYDWIQSVRTHTNSLLQKDERTPHEISDAYRLYDELEKEGLIADSDVIWYAPLLREYHWERSKVVKGQAAVEAIEEAIKNGLPETEEVRERLNLEGIETHLSEADKTERDDGVLKAIYDLNQKIETPPYHAFASHPRVHDHYLGLIEKAIDRHLSDNDVDPREYLREELSRIQPLDGFSEYTSFWRERLRVLDSLRQGSYENYLVDDRKLRPKIGVWLDSIRENAIFNASDELLTIFKSRLSSTIAQLDSWKQTEVDDLFVSANSSENSNTLDVIRKLGWAYRMNTDDNRVRNKLDQLIRTQLNQIVENLKIQYRNLVERTNTLEQAQVKALELSETIRAVRDSLSARNHDMFRGGSTNPQLTTEITELHRNIKNYEDTLRQIVNDYQLALSSLQEGFKTKQLTIFQDAYNFIKHYTPQHTFSKSLTDLMNLVQNTARIVESATKLDQYITGFRQAFEDEKYAEAQRLGQDIRTEVKILQDFARVISQNHSTYLQDVNTVSYLFEDVVEIITHTEQQDIFVNGNQKVIVQGRVAGINDHIEVIRQRAASATEWNIWWNRTRSDIAYWMEYYVSSLYGTEHLSRQAFDRQDIQTRYKALGLPKTVNRMQLILDDELYRRLVYAFENLPDIPLYSVVQRKIIEQNLDELLKDYPHPELSARDLYNFYLNVPGNEFVQKLTELVNLFVEDARDYVKNNIQAMRQNLSRWERTDRDVNDFLNRYNRVLQDYDNNKRRNRTNKAEDLNRQLVGLVQNINNEIQKQRQIDPSYKSLYVIDLENGRITRHEIGE